MCAQLHIHNIPRHVVFGPGNEGVAHDLWVIYVYVKAVHSIAGRVSGHKQHREYLRWLPRRNKHYVKLKPYLSRLKKRYLKIR